MLNEKGVSQCHNGVKIYIYVADTKIMKINITEIISGSKIDSQYCKKTFITVKERGVVRFRISIPHSLTVTSHNMNIFPLYKLLFLLSEKNSSDFGNNRLINQHGVCLKCFVREYIKE